MKKICLQCRKEVKKRKGESIPRWKKRKLCSRSCYYKNLIGRKRPKFSKEWRENMSKAGKGKRAGNKSWNWKGGIKKHYSQGYILLHKADHPYCQKGYYVLRSRFTMEKHIGRYLTSKEVVHHINGIVDDDRIENLMLFKNQSEHISFHHKSKRRQNG